ncbi:MAG TPA: hypothetical protein VE088_02510 [Gaiellaceae bacterium]|jgi:hypothetical protein|nr:hypothetical protein [Gaiellaceae bacterium]
MGEDKPEGVFERNRHKFALGGQAVAVGSLLLLVPVVRRLREQRQARHHHRRFPLLGH